jgi:hypothetical protein
VTGNGFNDSAINVIIGSKIVQKVRPPFRQPKKRFGHAASELPINPPLAHRGRIRTILVLQESGRRNRAGSFTKPTASLARARSNQAGEIDRPR